MAKEINNNKRVFIQFTGRNTFRESANEWREAIKEAEKNTAAGQFHEMQMHAHELSKSLRPVFTKLLDWMIKTFPWLKN